MNLRQLVCDLVAELRSVVQDHPCCAQAADDVLSRAESFLSQASEGRTEVRLGHDVLPSVFLVMSGRKRRSTRTWPENQFAPIEHVLECMSDEERRLRYLVGRRHASTGAYWDDGECQDSTRQPYIDFVRMPALMIQDRLRERARDLMVKSNNTLPPHQVNYIDLGMALAHDMPCPILGSTEHAVLRDGAFHPSWRAQGEGWVTLQIKTKFQAWVMKKMFGIENRALAAGLAQFFDNAQKRAESEKE